MYIYITIKLRFLIFSKVFSFWQEQYKNLFSQIKCMIILLAYIGQ